MFNFRREARAVNDTIDRPLDGSGIDTLLAVYVGDSVNSLREVARNDNMSSSNPQSRVNFSAVTGTQYHIAIDGRNGAIGNTAFGWNLTRPLFIILGASPTSDPPNEDAIAEKRPLVSFRLLAGSEYLASRPR